MGCSMTDDEIQRIYENEKNIAVILTTLRNTNEMLCQIRDNHLVHLSSDMNTIKIEMREFRENLSAKIESEIKELRKEIDEIERVQDKQSPLMKWGEKIVETILIAVIVGILVLLGIGKL